MTIEYGLFWDEGCVESGMYSEEEAKEALLRYSEEDGLEIHIICPEHPEQIAEFCEECNCDDDEAN